MDSSARGWVPTLVQEWMLIGAVSGFVVLCLSVSIALFPEATQEGRRTPATIVAGLAMVFGQVGWISMDRKRRGRDVGAWRFLAVFCGPLPIWLYLALEYRIRALYLIPLSIAIYVGTLITGVLGMSILQALRE